MTTNNPRLAQLRSYIKPTDDDSRPLRLKLLEPFLVRGLASADQASLLSGVEYKRGQEILNDLAVSSFKRPAALWMTTVMLEGKLGRPKKLYLLTQEGTSVLRDLCRAPELSAPSVRDGIELNAAYAIMEIYTSATQATGLHPAVEKTLPFGEGRENIRVDVLIETDDGPAYIYEIEQVANQGTLSRVIDKLRRMRKFFATSSAHIERDVRILFNLPQRDSQTLPVWQEALEICQAEAPLDFDLYWMPILNFIEQPDWKEVTRFQRIEPESRSSKMPSYGELSEPSKTVSTPGMKKLYSEIQGRALVVGNKFQELYGSEAADRAEAFFLTMYQIYAGSHRSGHKNQGIPVPPVESLDLLNVYLHSPENKNLLLELRLASDWLQRRVSWNSYVLGANRILWDVFLRFHGLGDSQMIISIFPPNPHDEIADITVKVTFKRNVDWIWERYLKAASGHPTEALSWVLTALLKYPYDLGLAEMPWRTKRKGAR